MKKSIQYISNDTARLTAVIVPIALWRELESEKETMKQRLLSARKNKKGISLEQVRERLGV